MNAQAFSFGLDLLEASGLPKVSQAGDFYTLQFRQKVPVIYRLKLVKNVFFQF